ncbi:alanine--tRNA ligase [Lederbergia galactosidilytica]|uniref:Alanine--tRNA ligase n=1 Tax=Lederbergia galactosidilytica TaxID=217031 RepID=A0A178A2L7_9BACI|nr:alanine--tRNA ligase [Lederbergia galactosidilytica]MBP1914869.1 alanyl-tRNA synthetase [Lederbergia galactosidilytica]OAK74163.1 alanine--tRNA ligase [Lederbergia galactosidilytica]
MKQLTGAEIRQMYLDFFQEKGHKVEPSASLIPHDDPTLLWINSGVATLKKYFDGRVKPDNPRIVNAQKSIRTNDIENVGKTARHHTFFEMLGNFSIGDYFKEEAIEWAWEFLTDPKWIGFEKEKLSVTIHPEDDEAFALWHDKVGLPEERIIRLEENFWDIGEGPSGPNTEIFYDRGPEYGDDPNDPELYPGGENERYLEIWNLVFSQFNHNPDGTYTPLPKKNIDTGMGLERMASVIQNAPTNFDTDLFLPIIHETEKISGQTYDTSTGTAFKVIADHIRTVSFAIADGALPSNEGRGYVLRRLLRRAVRYAKQIQIEKPFMYKLVPTVAGIMKDYYPNVIEKTDFIQKVIKNEEDRFHETLHDGLEILSTMIRKAKEQGKTVIDGSDVFKLYDTYGFPVELTEEYAEEEQMGIDHTGFEKAMEQQRERARSAREDTASMHVQGGILSDLNVASEFIGYGKLEVETIVKAIVKNGELVESAEAGDEVEFILEKTPFYAESGGQVADHGQLIAEGLLVQVTEVQKAPNGQNLHKAKVEIGVLSEGMTVHAQVDEVMRRQTEKNHTVTHLLHQALKDVLGQHVNQAGSYVGPDRLRFDFSHFGQVKPNELEEIEHIVNEKIWESIPVTTEIMPIEKAKEKGAMALFGEKYGKVVRVVSISDYSLELCGGCHVRNSASIGFFKILSESGIGAGTRRIEAVTGKAAYEMVNAELKKLNTIAELLKTKPVNLIHRVESLLSELKDVHRENESLAAKMANQEAGKMLDQVETIKGINVLVNQVQSTDMNTLRTTVDDLKQKISSGIIVLASSQNGKVNIIAAVTKDLTEKYHAGKLVKEVAAICGGGGGGRPDMAQAGGKKPEKLEEALHYVKDWVKSV